MAGVKVRELAVPSEIVGMRLFDRTDYQDAFSVQAVGRRSPEQLMRDTFEDAPKVFLELWARVLGHAVLGLNLDQRDDPSRVVGWEIVADHPGAFVIGLDTPRGLDARLVALTPPGQELISTQIHLRTGYARRVWPVIRAGHRLALPFLLRQSIAREAHT